MNVTGDNNKISVDKDCMAVFDAAFSRIETTLEYNPKWSNGMGMYDYAIYGEFAPRVAPGKMVRSASPSGRRIVFIGTRLGVVVVFERMTGAKNKVITIHVQMPSVLLEGGWFSSNEPDDYELELALGDARKPNLGQRLETLFMAMKKTVN